VTNDIGESTGDDGTKLSKEFADKVKSEIDSRLKSSGLDPKLISNISPIESKGNDAVNGDTSNDYRVDVKMENDTQNSKDSKPKEEKKGEGTFNPEDIKLIDNLIIDEGTYFDFIDENYPNYFKYISEKIKYFHAGFHSITPEGFNSRLTFLNQCMRQGPSIYDRVTQKDGTEVGVQPQNLSFGRPPICILRIGDFFHTKVAIQSLSITYDGPQWDLNPEGIGVQPMIATVSLGIDYIGGHSLVGPLNRLQNAVSFNYYANTEMYDVRSDKIGYNTGKVIDGVKLGELKKQLVGEENLNKYINSLKKEGIFDQTKDNENSDNGKGSENTGVLDISAEKPSNIVVKTKDGKAASDVEVDGEKSPDNKIIIEIKAGKNPKKEYTESTASKTINISTEFSKGLVNPEKIKSLTKQISDAKTALDSAKQEQEANPGPNTKSKFRGCKQKLEDAEKELKIYKSENSDSVKVEAYLSKNKKTTKITKTFTITENGLT
jgi:hypothetical protein